MFVRMPDDGGDGWGDDPDTADVDEGANDDFGDLRLLPNSPAINAGDPDFILDEGTAADRQGKPRVLCGRLDVGAYESGMPGDANCDGTLDLIDHQTWPGCMAGPDNQVPIDPACYPLDLVPDARIDLKDFAGFSQLLTTP